MNLSITINDNDVKAKLQHLAIRTSDMTNCMERIGQDYERWTIERFSAGADPEGRQWQALSPKYLAWKTQKVGGGLPILTLKSHLRQSIHYTNTEHSVTIGSTGSIKYAAIHQFGKAGKMPARPYLAMNVGSNGLRLADADKQKILDIIQEYIDRS